MVYPERIKKIQVNIVSLKKEKSFRISRNSKKINIEIPWRDDWKFCFISLLRELVKISIILNREITETEIKDFQRRFYRFAGDLSEEDPMCPTYEACISADMVAKKFSDLLDVDWQAYNL
jgi:hypothetical protein